MHLCIKIALTAAIRARESPLTEDKQNHGKDADIVTLRSTGISSKKATPPSCLKGCGYSTRHFVNRKMSRANVNKSINAHL